MREYCLGPKAGVICAAIGDGRIETSDVAPSTIKKYLARMIALLGRKVQLESNHFRLDGVMIERLYGGWFSKAMLALVSYRGLAHLTKKGH
jgi:hypothetical protein